MGCLINQGYTVPCASVGGAEIVYLGNWSSETAHTMDSNNVVTAVANSNGVYTFEQEIETAGLVQTATTDRANLTAFMDTNMSIKLFGLDAETRNLFVDLLRAPIYAIIKSNEGLFYVAGVETPGRLSEGTASLGVALGDMNGAEITINFKSKNGVFLIDGDLLGTDIPLLPVS